MTRGLTAGSPWTADVNAVAEAVGGHLEDGLRVEEASRRFAASGPNELIERAAPTKWTVLVRQFTNTMTAVLAVAAAATVILGDIVDAVVIGAILVVNAAVGFIQEHRAEQAMAALKMLTRGTAKVVREGQLIAVPAADVVVGDLMEIVGGDVVPADGRLVEARGLMVNESSLTGEWEPSAKAVEPITEEVGSLVADRSNMVFKGTAVTRGRGRAVVTATGMCTELGQIASVLHTGRAEPTPLQRRLAQLGRWLAAGALAICTVVFLAGMARGEPAAEILLTSVSLAVAAIPEGLPAVVTVALALGARRMAERHAVIRRLPAVETLGSVTVICSDKTGTLTQNRMTVERLWTPHGSYHVTGNGYGPAGIIVGDTGQDDTLVRLAHIATACNDAVLHAPAHDGDEWTITGDPTEGALLSMAAKVGVDPVVVHERYPRVAEIPFDAIRQRMTTLQRDEQAWWVTVKGAPIAVAPLLAPCDGGLGEAATEAANLLAGEGYRVLALAERRTDTLSDDLEDLEHDLRIVGLVGIADPPRLEAAAAIEACRAAGITPVMITGDHPRTATVLAQRLGLVANDDPTGVISGTSIAAMDDASLEGAICEVRVFARTNPEQKLRIVDAWHARHAVVAMTGDGVNDAPALQRADIGVAMGLNGTDVSKEAADMVLADDNFATIVDAVEEGRRIYDNIRRFVRYLLTTNSAELWVMFLAPFFGLPLPLLPIQILWINLVTDGLPAVALGLEPVEPDAMQRRPRPPEQSILGDGLWQHALWVGLLMAAVVLPLQALSRAAGWPWQTMVFTTLALLQLGHAVAIRSERRSILRVGFRTNRWMTLAVGVGAAAQLLTVYLPPLQEPFGTEPLTLTQLMVVLTLSSTALIAVELEKLIRRRTRFHAPG
jgi:Ca2+-transporting ATPase